MMEKKLFFKNKKKRENYNIVLIFVIALIGALIIAFFYQSFIIAVVSFFVLLFLVFIYLVFREKMKRAVEIKKMEEVFPDFIELVATNLRAGMVIDRALLLSSRKEFAPLDKEIFSLGKAVVAGEEITQALINMAERTNSEKIKKTVLLITSGIRAGGNLSVLLETTAMHLRERSFIEKRSASNVLMYQIFIFFAVAVGGPALFSLSSALVDVLSKILSNVNVGQAPANIPFTITKLNISSDFVFYFSIIFVLVLSVLSSLMLGLISKGNEKEGIKFILPLSLISLVVFISIRAVLLQYFGQLF